MKLIILLYFFPIYLSAQENFDLIIKNGKIIDGTGNSWVYGDIGIKNGRISKTGKLNATSAINTIDAAGLIIAPGFIDVHTHIEGEEATTPTADNFIFDGVTTVVTGNCGGSTTDVKKYLRWIDSIKLSINIATLFGHNNVRRSVMGTANRMPTEEELIKMEALVTTAMQDGAVGLSTGLIYIPGTYSQTAEIIRLAKTVSLYNGIYSTHMRNEGDSVVQAIQEALHIGREAGIPVEISHFKVSGQQNWKRSPVTLGIIKDARDQGIEVTIDQYPYTASSTSLSTLIPENVLSDGADSIKARLNRPDVRKYVKKAMLKNLSKRKLKHFSYAVVASYKADTMYNGKSIEAINLLKGNKHKANQEAETVIDMMLQGGAQMVFHGMSEWDVKNILQYPYNMFASDAGIRAFGQGVPHPRGYGTNARVLSKYVRDEKLFSLEEAIRRMTSLPAQKFHLKDRGLLLDGYAADIVIFNSDEVKDISNFEQPHAYHTGQRSGMALYGPGFKQ